MDAWLIYVVVGLIILATAGMFFSPTFVREGVVSRGSRTFLALALGTCIWALMWFSFLMVEPGTPPPEALQNDYLHVFVTAVISFAFGLLFGYVSRDNLTALSIIPILAINAAVLIRAVTLMSGTTDTPQLEPAVAWAVFELTNRL